MKLKFTCRNCKKTGFAELSMETQFTHAPWYESQRGLLHNCIYCRSCGAVHDTIGSAFIVGEIKLLFRRVPSDVQAAHEFSAFKNLLKMNNPGAGITSLHPIIIEAMIEDGRLTDTELVYEEPPVDFLLECLKDKSWHVRREAAVALSRFADDERVVDTLIETLKDKNWQVRRDTAITLGEIGDSRAIEPLSELLRTETWEHLVRKEATIALKKLRS
ncbi:hypothetical protein ES703_68867 [subsurface metagenome]